MARHGRVARQRRVGGRRRRWQVWFGAFGADAVNESAAHRRREQAEPSRPHAPRPRPPVRLSVRLSACPPVRLSACPSVCPPVRPSVRLSACPSVCRSVRPHDPPAPTARPLAMS
ncbi:Protein of unknown function [Micromonospora lupini str. Lupac 08]|uniref:Uncharacterized protein n=1 Tax=Micromonospora lupini str. Lupac 08 TaxID=1150864 RepID=I0L654_9ACTN|nr:Protein of unknown function [Micromonospora lupini str. Lupac 08]